MIELFKNLSTYISIPLLCIFGWIIFQFWQRIEKLKNEQIKLGEKITALKNQEIKLLERHIEVLREDKLDPTSLLSSVEILEKANRKELDNLKQQYEAATAQYHNEKEQRVNLEKAHSRLKELLENDFTVLRMVSHEAASPLVGIRGAANRLRRKPEYFLSNPEKMHAYLKNIEDMSEHLLLLFSGMAAIGTDQSQTLELQPTSIANDLIYPLKQMVYRYAQTRTSRNVSIEYEEISEVPKVLIDRQITKQAFFNIIINAIKHYNSNTPSTNIRIISECSNNFIAVKFQDNGIGVPTGCNDVIFEAGYRCENAVRLSPVGIGIGLTVSRKAAELHNGKLILSRNSNPTEFTYTIPVNL
ncbi:MAG TPA: HAMP domain-containing sensor histidine kinase [Desulfatiglandales bacterium]|nr:HAMP domain-containing sensor histidine kinase [Desulfatiglandales bacterium]